jgi:tetratricopeptide (TPR) repeat protein
MAQAKAPIAVEEEVTDELEDIDADEDTDAGAAPTKPPAIEAPRVAAKADFEKPSDTGEWYSKSDGNADLQWDSDGASVWKQRLPGIALAASVAAVLAVLLSGSPRHEDEPKSDEMAEVSNDPKRAGWPKTDETAIVIKSAVPQQPPVEQPAVSPPAPAAVVPAVTPPPEVAKVEPPPAVAPPVVEKPKVDPAAAEEAAKAAEAALAKGSLNAAKAGFDKAIAANPENAEAHSGLAMVYVELGRDRQAKASAHAAIKLDANQPRAQLVLALIAANGSDMETAKKYYKKYLQLAPNGKHAEEVRRILKTLE